MNSTRPSKGRGQAGATPSQPAANIGRANVASPACRSACAAVRQVLIVGEGGGANIEVWEAANGRVAWTAGHVGNVHAAVWSADGATVFTGGPDQWVRAWNGSSGAPRPPAIKMVGGISSVGVTRDGARLLSGTAAGDVRLIDVARGGLVASAMRHHGYVFQSRFSPDGSLALTSASDWTVRLWDARTGEPLSPSLSTEAIGRSATFLANGRAVAWGGRGVFVHELTAENRSVEQLRVLVESTAGRALLPSGTEVALATDEVQERFLAGGGSLLMTPLKGADGNVYAIAKGNLVVSGFGAGGSDGSKITVTIPSAGRIPGGATVERPAPTMFGAEDSLVLNLFTPDFTTANRLSDAINDKIGLGTARAVDGASVSVQAPRDTNQRVAFVSMLENLTLEPGERAARVVVNSRTGTVVIGRFVRVTSAAVTHGNLTVTIKEKPIVSQPAPLAGGTTVVVPSS